MTKERPAYDAKLPETFVLEFQPYGRYTLADLKLVPYPNYEGVSYPALRGRCVDGATTSYLFGHTSTRSAVGQEFDVWGITIQELAAGRAVRVAM